MTDARGWTQDRLVWVLAASLVAGVVAIAAAYAVVGAASVQPPPGTTPTVDFAPSYGSPGDAIVNVTFVSRAVALDAFRVDLQQIGNGTMFSVALRVGTLYQNASTRVTFEDQSDPGRLSVGDRFLLYNLSTGKRYFLVLTYTPAGRTSGSVTLVL